MKRTNIIYLLLILAVVICLLLLPIIKVPISISAQGVVRPKMENTKILSLVNGRVTDNRIIGNNQHVKQGDTLLVVVSKDLENKLTLNQDLMIDYSRQINDLQLILNGKAKNLQGGQYQLEYISMEQRMSEIQSQVTLARRELNRNNQLYKQGVVSQAELDKSQYSFEQLENQLLTIRKQQMAQWSAKLVELKQKTQSLSSEKKSIQIDGENYIVRAPISGTVVNFKGYQKGSQVVQGQDILEISPEDNLIAECLVPAKSIGYIKDGQLVKFQMDTYNYNQWGFVYGKVHDIDYNLIVDQQKGTFFKIRCVMEQKHLSSPNGNKVTIGKGNTFNARFYLLDRTLWQLLFDRADDLFNPNLGTKSAVL
ncbi:HlyD family secretion protein [Sphingobacterium prati]|uniref:HlyD family secretion protein n=1 Tax=Sphingobacterium prati TaxID=2737006 RepID=UPI00155457A1|nr:HlyD family efflux transporter periplasmic adaptor subunit [Sphingobacterium prati]NPE44888.1 HlyD family efflux transporter periplasmic adaptor subunit [Sphingobacterium prati]